MASSSTPIHSLDTYEFSGNNGANKNGRVSQLAPRTNGNGNGNGYDLGELVERTDSSASSSSSWDLLQQDPSTIVELGSETPSEYDGSINGQNADSKQLTTEDDFVESMKAKIMEEMGGQVWAVGKQSATKFYNLYANIDVFRPYFDVEPRDVLKRLANSLIPRKPLKPQTVPGELYGPVMLVFTLVALLLFSMKSSGHVVQEGTLMGTAIGVSFGYWIGASALYTFIAYLCNSHVTFLQVLTLTGYGLFGHCLAILFTSAFYHNSHSMFYVCWMVFGGLSTTKMVSVYISRTWSKKNGIIVAGIVAFIHMMSLIYFHFAYHAVIEETMILLSRAKRGDDQAFLLQSPIVQISIGPSALLNNSANSAFTGFVAEPSKMMLEATSPPTMMLF